LSETGKAAGILFGRERSGLTNEELSLADEILTLPVDPKHASLNIAQAVLIVAYEWRRSGLAHEEEGLLFSGREFAELASKEDLVRLFEHLEEALDRVNFFRPPEKKPHMTLVLRAILQRARMSEQEVRTLRGVIAALEDRPTRPHKERVSGLTTARSKRET
jgi:tRNA/rRNA methyltransferase